MSCGYGYDDPSDIARAEREERIDRCAVCATDDHDVCDGVALYASGGHGPCACHCERARMVRLALAVLTPILPRA